MIGGEDVRRSDESRGGGSSCDSERRARQPRSGNSIETRWIRRI